MKIEKIFWIVLISISTHNEPVSAQSYSHEFVNPDGSSVMCSTTTNGYTGKTACANIPLKERLRRSKNRHKMVLKQLDCMDLAEAQREPGENAVDNFRKYEKCMGYY